MNTDERGAAQPQPQNPPRRREERKVFEIAFLRILRVLRVFAVENVLDRGQWRLHQLMRKPNCIRRMGT